MISRCYGFCATKQTVSYFNSNAFSKAHIEVLCSIDKKTFHQPAWLFIDINILGLCPCSHSKNYRQLFTNENAEPDSPRPYGRGLFVLFY